MTNWKDTSDTWKDSTLFGQLMAALFSWKRSSNLSPGVQHMFYNGKMPKPARLPQLAGKPPQSWFYKLTTTVPRWWSKCRLQIYCFNFFCLTKALQILKWINVTFVPVFSKSRMTEILCNFWKEPPCTIQLRLGTICETNVRCLVAVCHFLAGSTPQSRFLRLHHPSMVSKIYTWWIQMFFLPSRGEFLFWFYRCYQFTNIEVTNTSFLRRFIFIYINVWILNFDVEREIEEGFWVSVSFSASFTFLQVWTEL